MLIIRTCYGHHEMAREGNNKHCFMDTSYQTNKIQTKNEEKNSVRWWKWSYQMCVCVFLLRFGFVPISVFNISSAFPRKIVCQSIATIIRWMNIINASIMEKSIRNDGILFYVFCERENTCMCVCVFAVCRWCKFPNIQREIKTQRSRREKKIETQHLT